MQRTFADSGEVENFASTQEMENNVAVEAVKAATAAVMAATLKASTSSPSTTASLTNLSSFKAGKTDVVDSNCPT
ncbi:hypothetical protein Ciccas_008836 [Cichlidogyrus casuarinus]|uniref:Uncharacterized protein n=1 Tax=Cichlidogyrus casuarinus TaxID=1844966 RepID=A0ABD2PYR3_9PLAT